MESKSESCEAVADTKIEVVCSHIVIEPNDSSSESEPEPESPEPEPVPEPEVVCEPEPVQMPKKKGKYTITDKVRERNRKRSMVAQERRREMKRKAAEYDALKAEKSLTKKDAEELFTKIVELNNSSKFQSSRMPSISEDAETGYNSDPVRKTSSRFSRKEAHVNHMSSRFTRF